MRSPLFRLTALLIGLGVVGTAHSAESGIYFGAGIGNTSTSIDNYDSASSYRVLGGYHVEAFNVEAGYTDLGEFDIKGGGNARISIDGLQLGVVAEAFMNPSLNAYVTLGFYQWDMESTAAGSTTSDDGSSPFLGAGLKVKMSDTISIRGGWERFTDISDEHYDLLSLGALLSF